LYFRILIASDLFEEMNGSIVKSAWHKKAKWMMKNVLIKPPSNSTQMRNLCTSIIAKQHGVSSPSAAVVTTALQLWDDPNLVNALQKNMIYLNAKERIKTTANHIFPTLLSNTTTTTTQRSHGHVGNISSALPVIETTLHQAVQCPACGNHLQCKSGVCETSEIIDENDGRFAKGSVGNVPTISEDLSVGKTEPTFIEDSQTIDINNWFGPLVLAAFTLVGLAVAVYNGEIGGMQNASSRALAAVSIVMQTTNSIFGLFHKRHF